MFILEESPFYQEIIEQAKSAELRDQIVGALEYRFGSVPDDTAERLTTLDRDHLAPLVRAAWTDDSLATFLARLTP
jgi:hypothetical protein